MEFTCKLCKASCNTAENCVTHFDLTHRLSSSSRFLCGIESCLLPSVSLEKYQCHLNDFHTTITSGLTSDHTSEVKKYKCNFSGCSYECNVASTLRVHRKRKHVSLSAATEVSGDGESLEKIATSQSMEPPPDDTYDMDFVDEFPPDDFSTETNSEVPCNQVSRDMVLKKYIHLYLSLRAKYHVPESTIQFLIDSHFSLAKESGSILIKELETNLKKCGIDYEKIADIIQSTVSNQIVLEAHDPKGPLRSAYMRKKNYTSTFRYVKPRSHKLGLNKENTVRKCHSVSIKDTIVSMLEDDSVFEQYIQTQTMGTSTDDIIRDIYDGSLVKNHPILSKDKTAVGIIIYEDDLEIVNGLGPAKCIHKITPVEFTLSNLRPWSRMKEGVIKLALLVCEKDTAYFGLEKSLKPLLDELKDLTENGVEIRGKNVPVVLLMLLGDNLGTHTFTGYLENFSKSKYFCRYCEESRDEWRARWYEYTIEEDEDESEEDSDSEDSDDSDEDDESNEVGEDDDEVDNEDDNEDDNDDNDNGISLLDRELSENLPFSTAPFRTEQSYDECLEELKNKPASQDSVKGIVAKCLLNDVKNFHCVGRSPPCLPHDLMEGVIAYDIPLALKYFATKYPVITSDFINRRIKCLKLTGNDLGDRPAKVTDKMKKLRGGAIQNWNFLRFLPILIGDQILDKSDPVWQLILKLIELTRILTSPAMRRAALPVLKQKIYMYLKLRIMCFPAVPTRPKHHFLEHLAELVELFGCLMRVGTLSFESKHRFFKNTAHSKKNFKNITKTLSVEHQLAQSALSVDFLTCNYPQIDDPTPFNVFTLSTEVRDSVVAFFGSELLPSLACSDKVRFHGTWYKKGEAIVTCASNNAKVGMCLVEAVFGRGSNCYASGRRCVARLDRSLQVYYLHKSSKCVTVNLERIPDYVSYPIYHMKSKSVVLLKHILLSTSN